MIMRSLGLFLSTLILLAASTVWAAHPVGPGEIEGDISDYTGQGGEGPFPPFSELDRNSDGELDQEEVSDVEPLRRQFPAADVDQDGTLDQEEFSAFEVRQGVMPGLESEPPGVEPEQPGLEGEQPGVQPEQPEPERGQ